MPAGSLLNASLVGAKMVKGPGPESVSTRSAALTALTSVEKIGRGRGVLHGSLGGVHGGPAHVRILPLRGKREGAKGKCDNSSSRNPHLSHGKRPLVVP